MAGRRIIEVPEITSAGSTDVLAVDTGAGLRRITSANLLAQAGGVLILGDLQDVDVAGAATGQVLTKTAGGWGAADVAANLNDLTDVDTTGVTDGQTLIFGAGSWGVGTPATTLGDLTDVDVTGATQFDILIFGEGGSWVTTGFDLAGLSDVSVGGASQGQALVRGVGNWTAGFPSMAINNLTDVAGIPASNQLLVFTAGEEGGWNPQTINTSFLSDWPPSLNDLSDVAGIPTGNQLLVFTAGAEGGWGPQTINTSFLSDWPTVLAASQITGLAAGTAIQTTDSLAMVQGAAAVKQTGSALLTFVGSNLSSVDAELAALAGLTSAADKAPYFTGVGTAALMDFTGYGRSIAATANEAALKALVNLEIGTDVQAFDAGLQSIAGLTTGANQTVYLTAADTYATTALTAFARTLLDDPDAATMRGTLGYPNSGLTDNRLLRTDGTAGVYQQSGITVDDSNNVTGANDVDASGTVTSTSATFDISAAGRQLIVLDTTDPGSPTNIIWAQHDTKFIRIGSTAYETQFRGDVSFLANTTLTTDTLVAGGVATFEQGRSPDRIETVGDDATSGNITVGATFFLLEIASGPRAARFLCRADASPTVEILYQSSQNAFEVTTSDVTGTTGTDAKATLSVRNGVYEIENRLGFSTAFRIESSLQNNS